MNDAVLAALVGAVVAGLGGLLVPWLVARVPEPAPNPVTEPAPDDVPPDAPDDDAAPVAEEPPKVPYAEIAARPGLVLRSALVSAVAGGVLGAVTGLDWPLVWLLPLTPVAVALSVIDWHTRLLPRIVVVPATLAAIVAMTVVGLATGQRDALVGALVAMLAVRTFYFLMWWFLPGVGMGFGDVRLSAPVGLVLGWEGFGAVAAGIWLGMVVFGVPGLILAVARWDRRLMKKAFPFGPFMVVGAFLGLVWGTALAGRVWG